MSEDLCEKRQSWLDYWHVCVDTLVGSLLGCLSRDGIGCIIGVPGAVIGSFLGCLETMMDGLLGCLE